VLPDGTTTFVVPIRSDGCALPDLEGFSTGEVITFSAAAESTDGFFAVAPLAPGVAPESVPRTPDDWRVLFEITEGFLSQAWSPTQDDGTANVTVRLYQPGDWVMWCASDVAGAGRHTAKTFVVGDPNPWAPPEVPAGAATATATVGQTACILPEVAPKGEGEVLVVTVANTGPHAESGLGVAPLLPGVDAAAIPDSGIDLWIDDWVDERDLAATDVAPGEAGSIPIRLARSGTWIIACWLHDGGADEYRTAFATFEVGPPSG
jgi:hypothetical protein